MRCRVSAEGSGPTSSVIEVTPASLKAMNMRMYIVAGDIAVRHRELTEQLVIETDPTAEKVEGLFNDSAKPSSRGRYAIPLTM